MKIGVNGYEAVVSSRFGTDAKTGLPKRAGSSQYCYELLINFYRQRRGHDFYIFLPLPPTPDLPKEDQAWHYIIVKQAKLWALISLSRYFLSSDLTLDVFFSPTHYAPLYVKGSLAISIMDLSYLFFPELFQKKDLWQLKVWTYLSAKRAKKIFTISNSSRNDIINKYRLEAKNIVVTYPGIKQSLMTDQNKSAGAILGKYSLSGKYLLFVGTIQPRKNLERLIEAFSQLKKDRELSLLIVGKPGWMYEKIYESPKKFGVGKTVKFLPSVDDEDLKVLYQNAYFFILPSLYEGFGLPVLEAMSFGTPVITSNTSSLPEAGGDACLYVDPLNVSDMTEKMEKLLTDKKLREQLIKKGYQQIKKFSWENTAQETLKALEELK